MPTVHAATAAVRAADKTTNRDNRHGNETKRAALVDDRPADPRHGHELSGAQFAERRRSHGHAGPAHQHRPVRLDYRCVLRDVPAWRPGDGLFDGPYRPALRLPDLRRRVVVGLYRPWLCKRLGRP